MIHGISIRIRINMNIISFVNCTNFISEERLRVMHIVATADTSPTLEGDFKQKKLSWQKQSEKLEELQHSFDTEKLSCDPARYTALKDQIEQLTAVVASLKAAMDEAEQEHAAWVFDEQNRRVDEIKLRRKQSLTATLRDLDIELDNLKTMQRTIPNQIAAATGKKNQILMELSTL
jgi:chromosome segregation ATPase